MGLLSRNRKHAVLLGDSVFDNATYVPKGEDVLSQLRKKLPFGWRATLLAVDGSTTLDVCRQIRSLPADASFLIVSAGGNDLLLNSKFITEPANSTAEVLYKLNEMGQSFQRDYRTMLTCVLEKRLPVAVCMIYYPPFGDEVFQKASRPAIAYFNSIITAQAFARGVPVLDMRLICKDPEDFSMEIEPSGICASKLTRAIIELLREHRHGEDRTRVYI